jgi:hypothetical protein
VSTGQRVNARQYLATVPEDVAGLPRAVLELTAATLRHHLAEVLAAIDADQAAVVLSALEDASDGIRERAAYCPACRSHPAALCDEDADRLSRAEAYDHLATQLRKATP